MTTAEATAFVEALREVMPDIISGVPFEYQLWDADQCARALGISRTQFDRIRTWPDFPKPQANLGNGKERANLRWRAKEVMRYRNVRG